MSTSHCETAQQVREVLNNYGFVPLTSVQGGGDDAPHVELWTRGSRVIRLSWPQGILPEKATDYTLSGAYIVKLAPADDERDAIYALSL